MRPAITHAPYSSQQELVNDQVAAIRLRIRTALDHLQLSTQEPPGECAWPPDLRIAEKRIEERSLRSVELPILNARTRFALTATEQRVLWMLIACELCPLTRQMCRGLSLDAVQDPTTDAIRRVAYGPVCGLEVWRELGPEGTLRKLGLIERADEVAAAPEHRQTWKIAARVFALVHGEVSVDARLAHIAMIESDERCFEDLALAGDATDEIRGAVQSDGLVVVHGSVGTGRRSSLIAAANERGLALLRVDARMLATEFDAARTQLRAISRECRLLGLVPLITNLEALAGHDEVRDRIELVESELGGLVLATARRHISRRWKRPPASIELASISSAQRASLWHRALPNAGRGDCELLASTYPIAPALIEAVGRFAHRACGTAPMKPAHIERALRTVLDDRLAGLAKRVEITQTWDDIVLPEDQAIAINEMLARVRERARVYEEWGFAQKLGKGLGVTALFTGPPGTGKTMAAGLVARALHVAMYQVDISKIVSKWIGETEKNLATLFDAAEAGHAILLFDEADSLFGKRTDVKSSNDRHANQETNFLLQRLETYAGICILTSNHEVAIDEAFRRRLTVHVRFPMPDVEERRRLWTAMLPASAPRADILNIERLANTFVMSGGYIRNAVLRAAFIAADEDGVIDAPRLARAAHLEYEAMGKIASFRA